MRTQTSFWSSSSRGSSLLFLLGVFLIFGCMAVIGDVTSLGTKSPLLLSVGVFATGAFSVAYAAAGFALRRRFWKAFIPLFLLEVLVMGLIAHWLPDPPQPTSLSAEAVVRLKQRLNWDGIGIIAAIILGYACFVVVTVTQAKRYFRVRAEIDLAMEIHRVLVPAIEKKLRQYEFYGRSSPSGDVGGDLIDLAGSEGDWVAYLADVSGHGVAPGVVMGMVKSAARMLLSSGADSAQLMPRLNEVLYPLKKPEMFATFCFVARNGDGLRIGLAGHPAILHFSGRTGEVAQLECQNLPLAILPDAEFVATEISAEPGDILALYSDGMLETENAAGEEFGSPHLIAELRKHAKEPLAAICAAIQESVLRHGKQVDDQSLLLMRRV